MTADLQRQGYAVHRKRVQRLMHAMGLEAIYPRPRLSLRPTDHHVYPYLLHDVVIQVPPQLTVVMFPAPALVVEPV